MAGFSNYWRNKAVSHLFGKEVYTPSATKYVGLSLSDPANEDFRLQNNSPCINAGMQLSEVGL